MLFLHYKAAFLLILYINRNESSPMSVFNVRILGCGSAHPTLRHNPSAQLLTYQKHQMLIDCGEGTQQQIMRYGGNLARIDHIFISHLHGDHFLGVPGLLSTIALHNIEGAVTIHTFKDGAELLRKVIDYVCRDRSFALKFDIIDPSDPGIVYEDNNLVVTAFPLYHRVHCVGYRFDEKPKSRHIDRPACDFHEVPLYKFNEIKEGADFVKPDGTVVPNAWLTTDPSPSASYAYCSDTAFDPRVAEAVSGVDVLYHEATYGDEGEYKAAPRGHSTARQAGTVARLANARKLIIGHYSKTIKDESVLVGEAAEESGCPVIAAKEGMEIILD